MYVILYLYLLSKSLGQVGLATISMSCHARVALLPLAGGRWRRPLHPLLVALGRGLWAPAALAPAAALARALAAWLRLWLRRRLRLVGLAAALLRRWLGRRASPTLWRRGCYCGRRLRAEAEGLRGAASGEMGGGSGSDGGDVAVYGIGGSRIGVHVGMSTCHFCIPGGS